MEADHHLDQPATRGQWCQRFVLAVLLIIRVDFLVLAWPIGSLLIFAVAAILVGVIAAILPARRAAKLNVLQALQYE